MIDILRLMNNIQNGCLDNSVTSTDSVQLYFQNNNSVTLTQRAFRRINGPTYAPSTRMVCAIVNKFRELRTTHDTQEV